jgi:uncharacterized protein
MKMETRQGGEIRATNEKGTCTAYLTKWDTIDSYNSTFEKGAFANSIKERGADGIRHIWNHSQLAGKVLDIREDDVGVLVDVQFNLNTQAGKDAYEHVRAGDVNCFSFGFNNVTEKWIKGVRKISNLDLLECGAVIFQANDNAEITDVRAEDFDETKAEQDLRNEGGNLLNALYRTIDDIYWGGDSKQTSNDIISKVDTAIAKFHNAYMAWLKKYYAGSRDNIAPREIRNNIQDIMNKLDVGSLVLTTSLTQEEGEMLCRGELLSIENRGKIKELPQALQDVLKVERVRKIETLCDEFRAGGLINVEKERFSSLLDINNEGQEDSIKSIFEEIRSNHVR